LIYLIDYHSEVIRKIFILAISSKLKKMKSCELCGKVLLAKERRYCDECNRKKKNAQCRDANIRRRSAIKEAWDSMTPEEQHNEMMRYYYDFKNEK
jgi:predicted amidophosphoribosyltransferase